MTHKGVRHTGSPLAKLRYAAMPARSFFSQLDKLTQK